MRRDGLSQTAPPVHVIAGRKWLARASKVIEYSMAIDDLGVCADRDDQQVDRRHLANLSAAWEGGSEGEGAWGGWRAGVVLVGGSSGVQSSASLASSSSSMRCWSRCSTAERGLNTCLAVSTGAG